LKPEYGGKATLRPLPIPLQVKGLGNSCQNPSRDTVPLIISLQIEASLDAVEKMLYDLSRSNYWTRARETAPSLIAAYSDKEKFMQVKMFFLLPVPYYLLPTKRYSSTLGMFP